MYEKIEYENLEFDEEDVDLRYLSYMVSLNMSGSILHSFHGPSPCSLEHCNIWSNICYLEYYSIF